MHEYQVFSYLDYYIGEEGEVCNDVSHVIRSKAECVKAVQSVSLQATSKWRTLKKKTIPSGCSINNVGEPYFEQTSTGLGTGRKDLTPICHDSMNSGILNINQGFWGYNITISIRICIQSVIE